MSRKGSAGSRKPGSADEVMAKSATESPPLSPQDYAKGLERKSLTDSCYDPGYNSMSCSTVTDSDISKFSASMLDSGVIEEEPPPGEGGSRGSGGPKSKVAASLSSSKLDSGYIESLVSAEEAAPTSSVVPPRRTLTVRDIYTQDDDGDTLLHLAAMEGQTERLCTLLCYTPHPDLLDIKNDLGQTALHLAALCGRNEEARLLMVAGATVDVRDSTGSTPLHVACRRGDVRLAQDLLSPVTKEETTFLQLRYKVTTDRGSWDPGRMLVQRTYAGDTSLHLAVRSGSRELVQHLLNHSATDPNLQERYSGATPLHLACRLERPDLAEVLVRSGRVEVNVEDYGRRTALRHVWDAHRSSPRCRNVLRLLLFLRDHGGQPLEDPGSEEEEDDEDEGSEEEDENRSSEEEAVNSWPTFANRRLDNVGCT